MRDRRVLEIGAPPRGTSYPQLISWAAGIASQVEVTWYDDDEAPSPAAQAVLDRLAPVPVEDGAVRFAGALTPELLDLIRDSATEFRDWESPELPDELRLLRADGSEVLATLACDNTGWLQVDEAELDSLDGDLAAVLDLHPPEELPDHHVDYGWSDLADTIVHAQSDLDPRVAEKLPCRFLGGDRFQVCCLPFQVLGLSLGDEITADRGADGVWTMREATQRHGRWAARVFVRSPDFDAGDLASRLRGLGAEVELAGRRALVVDVGANDEVLDETLDDLADRGDISVW
jgi:hypothetical protein